MDKKYRKDWLLDKRLGDTVVGSWVELRVPKVQGKGVGTMVRLQEDLQKCTVH